jgi:hypothetical protein
MAVLPIKLCVAVVTTMMSLLGGFDVHEFKDRVGGDGVHHETHILHRSVQVVLLGTNDELSEISVHHLFRITAKYAQQYIKSIVKLLCPKDGLCSS